MEVIGEAAFKGCKKLKKAKIGGSVTSIGNSAFANCTSLTSVTIPKSVTTLGNEIFKGDKKLKKITIKTTQLNKNNVSKKALKGVSSKATVKVPKAKYKTYKTLLKKKGLSSKAKVKK